MCGDADDSLRALRAVMALVVEGRPGTEAYTAAVTAQVVVDFLDGYLNPSPTRD